MTASVCPSAGDELKNPDGVGRHSHVRSGPIHDSDGNSLQVVHRGRIVWDRGLAGRTVVGLTRTIDEVGLGSVYWWGHSRGSMVRWPVGGVTWAQPCGVDQ